MRLAQTDDLPMLLDLMADFYVESGYALDRAHAEEAVSRYLAFTEALLSELPAR